MSQNIFNVFEKQADDEGIKVENKQKMTKKEKRKED